MTFLSPSPWRHRNELAAALSLSAAHEAKRLEAAHALRAGRTADAWLADDAAQVLARHAAPKCVAVGMRALGGVS